MDKESITISLERFQQMENTISRLEKENREKTIYKYILHPIYGVVAFVIFFYLLFFFPR